MASKEKEIFEKYFCEKYCYRDCSKGKMCSFKDYILSVNKKYLIDESTIGYGIKQMLNDLDDIDRYKKALDMTIGKLANRDINALEELKNKYLEQARKEIESEKE